MPCVLYLESNNVIELQGLTSRCGLDADGIVSGATVTAVVTDYAGTPVDGQVWPVVMTESAETAGTYCGTIDSTIELQLNQTYKSKVTAVSGDGVVKTWQCDVIAKYDC